MTSTCIPQCLSTFLGKWLWFTIQNPCNSSHLWRFQTLRNLVSCGRRGTSWHSNMFHNVSEVVLCDRGNTFALFSKTRCIFRGRRSTLETSIVILRGRHSTLDESCCVFFVNRIVKTASSGGNVQIHGRRCILWDVMKINGCLARNIHFEVVDFGVHMSTRRRTSILWLQSSRRSRAKWSFWGSNMSSLDSLVFLWRRRAYGGSCTTFHFRRFQHRF